MKRAFSLLSLVLSYAPDKESQDTAVRVYHKMRDAGQSELYIELALANIITTGIAYGNWPWGLAIKADNQKTFEFHNSISEA